MKKVKSKWWNKPRGLAVGTVTFGHKVEYSAANKEQIQGYNKFEVVNVVLRGENQEIG